MKGNDRRAFIRVSAKQASSSNKNTSIHCHATSLESSMEATCNRVGEVEDFDSRSVSSLTTVPVSNRSKATPDIRRRADKIPHNSDEKEVETIDTDATHTVGSGHQSVFSEITTSDVGDLDEDLQEEVRQAEQAAREAREAARLAIRQAKQKARVRQQKARVRQRKRRFEKAMQNEHEDAKYKDKKHRDDENGDEGGNSDSKLRVAAAVPAPVDVASK